MDFNELRKKANDNDAEAQYLLAERYLEGDGVEKSELHAVRLLEKSAAQDYAKAQFLLGVCYDNGDGVSKDEKKAFEWYSKAAGNGDEDGIRTLAACYQYGFGVDKNPDKAIEICLKGAESGNLELQCELAQLYDETGNQTEAVRWYRIAAEKNHAHSQYILGFRHQNGKDLEKNNELALKWYLLAANNGNRFAQEELGDIYYYNHKSITGQNYCEAVKWYSTTLESALKSETYYSVCSNLRKLIDCYKGGFGLKRDGKKLKQLKKQYKEMQILEKKEKEEFDKL